MSYFTALRRPDIFLRLYQASLAALPAGAPRLRSGGAPIRVKSIAT
jgi:hypothetical protein